MCFLTLSHSTQKLVYLAPFPTPSTLRTVANVKFGDDTVVQGFIPNNDETAYLEDMDNLALWYDNHLQLNVSKTNELVVNFCRRH